MFGLFQKSSTPATPVEPSPSAPPAAPAFEIQVVEGDLTTDWNAAGEGRTLSVRRRPVISQDSKIFAIGSCFAVEIRKALRERGFEVEPKYADIVFDREIQRLAKLPAVDNMHHYDTFTIRQEFEKAFHHISTSADDLWELDSAFDRKKTGIKSETVFQDPHRKNIYGSTRETLLDLAHKVDRCIGEGIRQADCHIITLGLIEVWKNKHNGKYICRVPRGETIKNADFELSTFEQNLENMRAVCQLLQKHRPNGKLILTVSPVGLGKTFTGRDIIVANQESKSVLRAVAGRIEREFENVIYWPAYETVLRLNGFESDGRHVRREVVEQIVTAFAAAHCEPLRP